MKKWWNKNATNVVIELLSLLVVGLYWQEEDIVAKVVVGISSLIAAFFFLSIVFSLLIKDE